MYLSAAEFSKILCLQIVILTQLLYIHIISDGYRRGEVGEEGVEWEGIMTLWWCHNSHETAIQTLSHNVKISMGVKVDVLG